jgi:hypothetical protein
MAMAGFRNGFGSNGVSVKNGTRWLVVSGGLGLAGWHRQRVGWACILRRSLLPPYCSSKYETDKMQSTLVVCLCNGGVLYVRQSRNGKLSFSVGPCVKDGQALTQVLQSQKIDNDAGETHEASLAA